MYIFLRCRDRFALTPGGSVILCEGRRTKGREDRRMTDKVR